MFDLDDTLSGLGHGNGCAPGHKHRLTATHIGEDPIEVTFHQDHLHNIWLPHELGLPHLLVPKPHLPARVSGHIHPAKKDPILRFARTQFLWACQLLPSQQLRLHCGVVLLVDDVVDAVPVDQQVLHAVTEVLRGVLRDVEQLPSLGDHHHEPVESLQEVFQTLSEHRQRS